MYTYDKIYELSDTAVTGSCAKGYNCLYRVMCDWFPTQVLMFALVSRVEKPTSARTDADSGYNIYRGLAHQKGGGGVI